MMGSGAGGRWHTSNMGLEGTARGKIATSEVWMGEGRGLLKEENKSKNLWRGSDH